MNETDLIIDLIKKLRKKNKLSQFQISELLNIPCSTYSMIESSHRKPNDEILVSLSNILNFDFITFSRKIKSYNSIEHYLLASELINYITLYDIGNIVNILENNSIIEEFNYGEPKIIKVYCEVLVLMHVKNDIELAYSTCVSFFKIDDLSTFKPKINMPNQYYSLMLNLGYCLFKKDLFHESLILYNTLINFLENLYFKSELHFVHTPSFHKKYYIICLNNIADLYFTLENFDKALELCKKGIEKSNKLNILSILPSLINLKVEILCKLNNYSDAKLTYFQLKSLCEITDKLDYFNVSTEKLKNSYPNFL